MYLTMFSILLITLISIWIIIMINLISNETICDLQKSTPFECGFNPMTMKRLPFSIHFFLIAVIFLIVDMEIIIILPMTLTMNTWILASIMFIMILTLGLYHEWKYGMLN